MQLTNTALNKLALLSLGVMAAGLPFDATHAAEPLSLKSSSRLGQTSAQPLSAKPSSSATNTLGSNSATKQGVIPINSNFQFRGVSVDDGAVSKPNLSQFKTELNAANPKAQSTFKAVYGGLQVSLKENLSLVYTPGRLSSATLNSESQGLYLLTNQDGLAHWFVGVESNSYSTPTDSRQTSNTAQIGIIVSLN